MAVAPFIGGLLFQRGGAEWTLALLLMMASLNVVLVAVLANLLADQEQELERLTAPKAGAVDTPPPS